MKGCTGMLDGELQIYLYIRKKLHFMKLIFGFLF